MSGGVVFQQRLDSLPCTNNTACTCIVCKGLRAKVAACPANASSLFNQLTQKHALEHQECCKLTCAPSTSTAQSAGSSQTHI